MPKIKVLPEEVARKIAAGEVIERPASVVKELVENAYDAGAQRVEVELEDGGLTLVRVRDDGHGMDAEDLRRCWLPHATSKISSAEDLLRVRTWGFRGEALAAIAAVSRLVISSRPPEALLGARLEVRFGQEVSLRECGHPRGTTVEVRDLFARLPARRAFLKGPRAEGARVLETARALALENPGVHLRVLQRGKASFAYEPGLGRRGLLARLAGLDEGALIEGEAGGEGLRVWFALSRPGHWFPSTRHFYFLVNGRLVRDRLLLSAVLEGLSVAFPRGKHPALVLALELAPDLVDVNVHPSKAEVRFREERAVYRLVRTALEDAFRPRPARPARPPAEEDLPVAPVAPAPERRARVAEEAPAYGLRPAGEAQGLRAIGPLGKEFFLLETADGLLVLDFHAAHERLLYERLRETYEERGVPRQRLLVAEPLSLSAEALERLEAHREFLERLGYEFDRGGPREVLVRAVPAPVGQEAVRALVAILEDALLREPGHILRETLALLACRAARRGGETPSPQEVEALVAELRARGLSTCPHGRPVFWEMGLDEIRRRFGR